LKDTSATVQKFCYLGRNYSKPKNNLKLNQKKKKKIVSFHSINKLKKEKKLKILHVENVKISKQHKKNSFFF